MKTPIRTSKYSLGAHQDEEKGEKNTVNNLGGRVISVRAERKLHYVRQNYDALKTRGGRKHQTNLSLSYLRGKKGDGSREGLKRLVGHEPYRWGGGKGGRGFDRVLQGELARGGGGQKRDGQDL